MIEKVYPETREQFTQRCEQNWTEIQKQVDNSQVSQCVVQIVVCHGGFVRRVAQSSERPGCCAISEVLFKAGNQEFTQDNVLMNVDSSHI